MRISEKCYSRDFVNENPKQAYLDACEWVAKTILNKNAKLDVKNLLWNISRVESSKTPTFRIEIHVSYDENDISNKTCELCQSVHSSFFINENYNCSRCNKEAYRKRLVQKTTTGCEFFKEKISRVLDKY